MRLLHAWPWAAMLATLIASAGLIALEPAELDRFLALAPKMMFGAFGIIAPLVALVLPFILPLRLMPLLFGWLLMPVVFLLFLNGAVPHFYEGNNAPIDLAFTLFLRVAPVVLAGILLCIRATVVGGRQLFVKAPSVTQPRRWPAWIVPTQLWLFAVLIALLLQFDIVQCAQGMRPAWLPHLAILAAGIGACVGAALLIKPRNFGRAAVLVCAPLSGFGCGLLFFLALDIGVSRMVIGEARRIAGNQPYCLQSADRRGEYEPVQSPLELSALTMQAQAEDGLYIQHHAVLVMRRGAGDEIFHWSYNNRTFLPQDGGPAPVIYCDPEPGFVDRLTWLGEMPGDQPATVKIGIAGRTYRIPAGFAPKASAAGKEIRIAAIAPDFSPVADARNADVLRLARITFEPYRYSLTREKELGVDAAPEHGLAKRTFPIGGFTITRYTSGDPSGTSDVIIECQTRGCRFLFVHDGVGYTFEADAGLVPQWKELESRVVTLFESWRVQP